MKEQIYTQQIEAAESLRRAGSVSEAYTLLEELSSSVERLYAESEIHAALLNEQGICARLLGDTQHSLELNQRSLEIRQKLPDRGKIAKSLNSVGLNYWGMGEFDNAFSYMDRALRIHQEEGDVRGEAVCLNSIGLVLWRMGNNAEAEESLHRAVRLFTTCACKEGEANALNNLALLFQEANEYRKALDTYKCAMRIFEDEGHLQWQANTWNNMALVLRLMKRYEDADSALDHSLELGTQIGMKRTIMLAHYGKAELAFTLREYEKAESHFAIAEREAVEQEEGDTLQEIYDRWAALYAEWGRFDRAYEMARRHMHSREKILNEEKNKVLSELRTRYRTEQKERENQLVLEKNRALNEANESKLRLFSIIGHDLRASAGGVRQLVDLLTQHGIEMSESDKNRLLDELRTSSQLTLDLLNNLLEWSRTQLDRIDLAVRSYNAAIFVERVLQPFRERIRYKALKINTAIPDELEFGVDGPTFAISLRNLINNAIKFSYRSGSIDVSARAEEQGTRIEIRDHGVGIQSDRLERMMHAEICQSTQGTENEKGSGLGFSLSRLFVERNGGTLSIKSTENAGTVVSILVPDGDGVDQQQ